MPWFYLIHVGCVSSYIIIIISPNFKGINRDINVIMFDIEPVAAFNTINLLLSMAINYL